VKNGIIAFTTCKKGSDGSLVVSFTEVSSKIQEMVSDYESHLAQKEKRIKEIENGYEELRIAALNAVPVISRGESKTKLLDALITKVIISYPKKEVQSE
jgi:hypothetical protein